MNKNILEALMGAVVLSVAVIFLVFAYNVSKGGREKGVSYQAHFDRIDGLSVGSDIKISGVKVGVVEKIILDPITYMAKVHLNVAKRYVLPEDTSAEILSESLMGGKYLALVPGGSDVLLKSGETIQYTQSAISLEGLIGKFLFNNDEQSNQSK